MLSRLQDDGGLAAGLLVWLIVDEQSHRDWRGHLVARDVAFRHAEVLTGQQSTQMKERGQAQQPRELQGSHGWMAGVQEFGGPGDWAVSQLRVVARR